MKLTYTLLLIFAISHLCVGQAFKKELHNLPTEERNQLILEESERIKDATLIIILPYYKAKIDRFNELLAHPSTDEKSKKRIIHLQESTIADRDSFNLDFFNDFTKEYTQTKVEFIYDKDLNQFMDEPNTRFLLNSLYEHKSDTKYNDDYFFGGFYHERSTNSSSGYYFVVANEKLNIYPKSMFPLLKVDNVLTHILTFGFNKKYGRADIIGKKTNNKMEKIQ